MIKSVFSFCSEGKYFKGILNLSAVNCECMILSLILKKAEYIYVYIYIMQQRLFPNSGHVPASLSPAADDLNMLKCTAP